MNKTGNYNIAAEACEGCKHPEIHICYDKKGSDVLYCNHFSGLKHGNDYICIDQGWMTEDDKKEVQSCINKKKM